MSAIRLLIVILIIGVAATHIYAQDLEQISLGMGVKLSGSLNLNTVGYYAHGIEQRRDPFNWFLTGTVNVNAFGYNAPFSFSYTAIPTRATASPSTSLALHPNTNGSALILAITR
jgi:hypothetical protein